MSNHEEWNEFLDRLLSNAIAEHKESREYEYQKQRQEQIDELLSDNLDADQKILVEEILFELGLISERETEAIYRRGLKDCVFMLKQLEVLS